MHADEVAGYLYVNGIGAASYHAGKSDQVMDRSAFWEPYTFGYDKMRTTDELHNDV